MKWIDAIKRVLQEEGQALHYEEISQKIIEKGYRDKVGATPAATVVSIVTTDINMNGDNSAFIRVGLGEYYLKQNIPVINLPQQQMTPEEEFAEEQEIQIATQQVIEKGLIKSFGMFWSRDYIFWKNNPSMFGAEQTGATSVDFAKQIGIYMLHDAREIIYVGQAIDQPIIQRLYQHTTDRLGGRWNRFSWFGFRGVKQDGSLTDTKNDYITNIQELTDTIEAILVEGIEPRQNRKRGNSFSGIEHIQTKDPEISKQDMLAVLDTMKSQIAKPR
jgi:hypothetical protein